jgi:hypothetical protein
MQSEREEEIKKSRTPDNQVEPEPELSEVWRTLLGMQSTNMQAQVDDQQESQGDHKVTEGDHKGLQGNHKGLQDDHEGLQDDHKESGRPQGSPLLANDPWSHLVQTQGVLVVDLQQMRLHAAHVPLSDIDVEKVLKLMQEQPIPGANEG